MVDPELIKVNDHGGVVNIFDCIKDSAMDRVGRCNSVIFKRTDLEGTDRGVSVVINSCSRRMFDATLLVLTLGVPSLTTLLLGVGCTYVHIVPGFTYV